MSDPNVDVIGVQDVPAVWRTGHPPIHRLLRSRLPTHVVILTPPGRGIAVSQDAVVIAGPVGTSVGVKIITSHVGTVLTCSSP